MAEERVLRWRGMKSLLVALVALALLLPAGGCGGEDEVPPPAPPVAETTDRLPKLPRRWEPYLNRVSGFSFGLPPGWRAKEDGSATQVRSLDQLVAVTISADRTDQALAVAPEDFAAQTLSVLPGYERFPDVVREKAFDHRYEGALASGDGVSDDGVRQEVSVIVLRRPGIVVLTSVIAANARTPQAVKSALIAARIVQTLRSRFVGS